MPFSVTKVLVCGAGTMGAGIAQAAIESGFHTVLFDSDSHALDKAWVRIDHSVQRHIEKKELKKEVKTQILDRLELKHDYHEIKADIVIEAIVEKIEAKIALFKDLSQYCPPETIFATNTSSLSVTEISKGVAPKERLIGIHFFNPATSMKLVEIVQTTFSDMAMVESAVSFVKRLGKTPVLVKDSPGFIVNRIARQYYLEAFRLAEDQMASYETIDRLLENAGFRMGPFALTDLIGQDINYATTQSLYEAFFYQPRFRPSTLQAGLIQKGYLGKKSGKGFFDY